jgi:hypothetical protein
LVIGNWYYDNIVHQLVGPSWVVWQSSYRVDVGADIENNEVARLGTMLSSEQGVKLLGLLLVDLVSRATFGKSKWAGLAYIGWQGIRVVPYV